MGTCERIQDGDADESGDGNEIISNGTWNGDEDGSGNRNDEGRAEAKKHNTPHKRCRCDIGNGADVGGKRETRRQELVRSVAANPDRVFTA